MIINTEVAQASFRMRQYDQAIDSLQKALEMDSNFLTARIRLGTFYTRKGMYDKAITELQKALAISGDSVRAMAELGYTYAVAGRRKDAEQVLAELNDLSQQRYVPASDRAHICVALGDKEQAFIWMEKAYEERSGWLIYLKAHPRLDSLRSDPRSDDLVRRVGLL